VVRKTEIEKIMEARNIRDKDKVIYYRLLHLINSNVYDGSVAGLKQMLGNRGDYRLTRLTTQQRALLMSLTVSGENTKHASRSNQHAQYNSLKKQHR